MLAAYLLAVQMVIGRMLTEAETLVVIKLYHDGKVDASLAGGIILRLTPN